MDLMQQLAGIPAIGPALPYIAAAIAIAAIMARFLPPPATPARGFYPLIYGLVNVLAQNGGQAVNAKAPDARGSARSARKSR